MRTYTGRITKLEPNQIFVFGSNTQGRHGKGAALWALQNAGAIYGQARGLQGQSYAIVTKDLTKRHHPSISVRSIMNEIGLLYEFACLHDKLEFLVAYTNKANLNGYAPWEMAKMFRDTAGDKPIPDNIILNEQFVRLVEPIRFM